MSGRLVFFGELLIRLTAPGNELLMQSPALSLHVGGAEANVAIGLAHLGHGCAMVSRVPANALGRGALAAFVPDPLVPTGRCHAARVAVESIEAVEAEADQRGACLDLADVYLGSRRRIGQEIWQRHRVEATENDQHRTAAC